MVLRVLNHIEYLYAVNLISRGFRFDWENDGLIAVGGRNTDINSINLDLANVRHPLSKVISQAKNL